MKIVLDTNIIVKLLLDEPDSQDAYNLFVYLQEGYYAIVAPDYARLEVYSVIRKAEERGEIGSENVRKAQALFHELPLEYVQTDDDLLRESYSFARKMGLYVVYDCLFLSVAIRKEAIFVSNDEKLVSSARSLFPSVCSLRSWHTHLS